MKLATGTAAALAVMAIGGGAGTALAHPGQGRGHDGDRHRDDRGVSVQRGPEAHGPRACVKFKDVTVGYVFRGTVAATTADSVTVNLSGANAHARRVLARATPPVLISDATTDLLLVPTPAGTPVFRNGVAGAPLVGDRVIVKYRAPHSKTVGKRCVVGAPPVVTVTGSPAAATLTGTGVQLKWVSAWGPAPS